MAPGILLLFARLRCASRTASWSQKEAGLLHGSALGTGLPGGTGCHRRDVVVGVPAACPSFMPDPPHLSQQKVCTGGVVPAKYFRHVFLGRAALAGSGAV